MEHNLVIISSKNEVKQRSTMRRNLPYQGIARRALNSKTQYDKDIDVSAVVSVSWNTAL
jgi:hypothetical protein